MSATMTAADWVAFIDREYLAEFVPAGGAALKFGVRTDDGSIGALGDQLADAALARDLLVARVDAATTRLHLADQFLFAVAAQVDWAESVDRVIATFTSEAGLQAAAAGDEPLFRRLAAANDLEPEIIQMELRRAIGARVLKARRSSKDFRVAMTQLALARLSGGPEEHATFETITDWLTGRNRAVSAVKPYQIHARISRTNARYVFESMLLWIASAGHPRLVVILDISRLGIARNPRDGRPPHIEVGEVSLSRRMRSHVRRWIHEWDLARLYPGHRAQPRLTNDTGSWCCRCEPAGWASISRRRPTCSTSIAGGTRPSSDRRRIVRIGWVRRTR